MITEAVARRTSGAAESCVQDIAIESVCLDAENSADDIGTVLDDGGVFRDRVD